MFVSANDFHLQAGSPCIDSGDVFFLDEDGTRADMGAYGGNGGSQPEPGNTPPNKPVNISPANNAVDLSPALNLTGGEFSDPDASDFHAASQWQIRRSSGSYDTSVFDSGINQSKLRSIYIPWGTLVHSSSYCWHVRYRDNKNAWSPYSDETCFATAVDSTPPSIALTSPVEGATVKSVVGITWAGSDNAGAPLTYSYRKDNEAWSSFVSFTGITLSGLSEGQHSFSVVARDYAGNVSLTPATANFIVDITSPIITSITTPNVGSNSAVISWSTDEAATSLVQYGPSSTYGYSSMFDNTLGLLHSVTLNNLTPGTIYHFRVLSRDIAGNEAISADYTFETATILDVTAPDTFIASGPGEGALINTAQVGFGWTGSDDITLPANLTFSYRLDSGNWSAFNNATSHTLVSLADGQHTFSVKAKDQAGNEDQNPATRTFPLCQYS
jgi:hypothetical protein